MFYYKLYENYHLSNKLDLKICKIEISLEKSSLQYCLLDTSKKNLVLTI